MENKRVESAEQALEAKGIYSNKTVIKPNLQTTKI